MNRPHLTRTFIACFLLSTVAACAGQSTASDTVDLSRDFGSLSGASLELSAKGGIAGLDLHQLVRHDDRAYVSTQRRLCAPSCGAPLDSVSGTLTSAASDSLFAIVWQQDPYSLKDDYGTTRNAADMMTYTLRVDFNGRAKTITADDGTMPPAMRAIVSAMNGIIAAAR